MRFCVAVFSVVPKIPLRDGPFITTSVTARFEHYSLDSVLGQIGTVELLKTPLHRAIHDPHKKPFRVFPCKFDDFWFAQSLKADPARVFQQIHSHLFMLQRSQTGSN
jgi:hypothetical protein